MARQFQKISDTATLDVQVLRLRAGGSQLLDWTLLALVCASAAFGCGTRSRPAETYRSVRAQTVGQHAVSDVDHARHDASAAERNAEDIAVVVSELKTIANTSRELGTSCATESMKKQTVARNVVQEEFVD